MTNAFKCLPAGEMVTFRSKFGNDQAQKILVQKQKTPDVAAMVESIVGCKWSLHVLAQIRSGTHRPGALARSREGLTTKVLNERLSKMVRFGILERLAYPEIPPRVEYCLTDFGKRFLGVLDEIDRLQRELEGEASSAESRVRS